MFKHLYSAYTHLHNLYSIGILLKSRFLKYWAEVVSLHYYGIATVHFYIETWFLNTKNPKKFKIFKYGQNFFNNINDDNDLRSVKWVC